MVLLLLVAVVKCVIVLFEWRDMYEEEVAVVWSG